MKKLLMKTKLIRLLCVCLIAVSALQTTGAQTALAPVRWERLNTELLADPLTDRTIQLFRQGLKYPVNDWYNKVKGYGSQTGKYLDFKGNTEHYIRPVSHVAFSLAVALRFHVYDEAVTGVPASEAKAIAVRLIQSLAYRHKACIGEEKGWGKQWQSAWWASQAAFAAWLLWDELDDETRSQVCSMTVYEADRFLDYKIPYYKDKAGKVIYKGDSKSEENAWNSDMLVLASLMFPEHPNAPVWHRRAVELQLSAYASPSDIHSGKTVNGICLKDFLNGSNMEENGTVVNHGIVHVDYTVAFMQNAINVLPYVLAGKQAMEVSLFNGDRIYNALNNQQFDGHTMYVRGKNGEATHEIYFPEGNDWGTSKQVNCWLMDVIAHCFGLDKGMKPSAADWMKVREDEMLRMQGRNSNGTYYQGKEDLFPSREEFLLAEIAFGYLFLWADNSRLLQLSNAACRMPSDCADAAVLSPSEEMDIYLCIGQSNMAGRALVPAVMQDDTLENVWLMNGEGGFEPARLPLNAYSNIRKDLSMQQLGPAWTFAQCVAQKGHQVGLVVNARGGSSIQQWEKGQKLYEATVERLKQALRSGKLKAILWHQGESNCSGPDRIAPEEYEKRLIALMENLRNEAGDAHVPVIIGQLGQWKWAGKKDIKAYNRMLESVPGKLPESACVSSDGLEPAFPGTEDPHFGAEAQLEFGKRYAAALEKIRAHAGR